MSGRAKARREAKAADRIARGKQRAQAELTRRWHLTLAQSRQVDTAYSRAAAELVAAALRRDAVDPEDEPFSAKTLAQESDDKMLDSMVHAAALLDAQPVPVEGRQLCEAHMEMLLDVYEPHCLMSWEEMKAGADDMAGVPNALNGDAT